MSPAGVILEAYAEILFLIATGYMMKWIGYLHDEDGKKLINCVVNYFVPVSLIMVIPSIPFDATALYLPFLDWLYATLVTSTVYFLWKKRLIHEWMPLSEESLLCVIGQAITLVGYPIGEKFFGKQGIERFATMDMGNFLVAYPGLMVAAKLLQTESQEYAMLDRVRCYSMTSDASDDLDIVFPLAAVQVSHRANSKPTNFSSPHSVPPIPWQRSISLPPSLHGSSYSGSILRDATGRAQQLLPVDPFDAVERLKVDGGDARGLVKDLLMRTWTLATVRGFLLGLTLRLCGVTPVELFPAFVSNVLQQSAACTKTITLFALGIFLRPELFRTEPHLTKEVLFINVLRSGMGLLFGFGLLVLAPWFSLDCDGRDGRRGSDVIHPDIITTVRMGVVMPVPPVIIAYAVEYGYNVTFMSMAVNVSLLISFVLAFCIAVSSATE